MSLLVKLVLGVPFLAGCGCGGAVVMAVCALAHG